MRIASLGAKLRTFLLRGVATRAAQSSSSLGRDAAWQAAFGGAGNLEEASAPRTKEEPRLVRTRAFYAERNSKSSPYKKVADELLAG